jgi:hypothetical protein
LSACRSCGFTRFVGDVLPDNEGMLKLARGLSFDVSYDANADLMHISKELRVLSSAGLS